MLIASICLQFLKAFVFNFDIAQHAQSVHLVLYSWHSNMTCLAAADSDPPPEQPEEMDAEDQLEQAGSKPTSRSVTPCSDSGMKGSPASGASKGSLKREHDEDEDCESELEIADSDGRNVFKNAGKLIDGAVTNSDFEVGRWIQLFIIGGLCSLIVQAQHLFEWLAVPRFALVDALC